MIILVLVMKAIFSVESWVFWMPNYEMLNPIKWFYFVLKQAIFLLKSRLRTR